jgi:kynurenine formamidase
MTCRLVLALVVLLLALVPEAQTQTRERGPWWPSRWGADDQAGASNWITPEKVLAAVRLVKTGRIYELGHPYNRSMPLGLGRSYVLTIPGSPTFGPWGRNQVVAHDELLTASIGQVGTQFDGPGHIGQRMRMADGSIQDVFYNGFTREEMRDPYGLRRLGVEHVKPIVTRGILVDVAGLKKVATLPAGYEVTVADVRAALQREEIDEASIAPGDAIFFNYGTSRGWTDPGKRVPGPPSGIGLEVARWIIAKQASMIGSDAGGTEVAPSDTTLSFPVHQELIMRNGIFNMENMRFDELVADRVYEFLFVFTPLRLEGATGSPARPLAIR